MPLKPIQDRHYTDILSNPPLNSNSQHIRATCKRKVKEEVADNPVFREEQHPPCYTTSNAIGHFEQQLRLLNENRQQQARLKQEEQNLLESLRSCEFKSYNYDGDTYVSTHDVVDDSGKGVKSARPFSKGEKVGDYEGKIVYRMPVHPNCPQLKKYVVFKLSNDLSAFQLARGQQGLQQKKCAIIPMTQDRYIVWSNCRIDKTDIEIGRDGTNNFCYLNHAKQANVRLTPHPNQQYIPWHKRHDLSIKVSAIDDIPVHTELLFNYDQEREINEKCFKHHSPKASVLTSLHKKRIADQLNEASNHQLALHTTKSATKPKLPRKQSINPASKRFTPPKLPCKCVKSTKASQKKQSSFDQTLEKFIQDAEKAGVSREVIFCTSNRKFKIPPRLWNTYSRTWNRINQKKILNKKDLINLCIALKSKTKKSYQLEDTWRKIHHTSKVYAYIGGFDVHLQSRLNPHYLSAFFARGDTTRDKE